MSVTALLDLSVLGTATRGRGIGRYVADLAAGLARRDARDVRVLGLERLTGSGAVVSDDLPAALRRLYDVPEQSHYMWAYALRLGLSRALRQSGVDLIHTPHPNATPLGELGCRRVTTCHDLIPLRYPKHYLDWRDGYRIGRRALDHRRYHSADHVIAVSSATAGDLVRMLGLPSAKISVVHNGVDLERWSPDATSPLPQALSETLGQRPFLLCVGPPEWRKNPEGTIAGFALARRAARDRDVRLVWAGGLSKPHRARIDALAEKWEVTDALVFAGFVSDDELCALYRAAVALLFVSRSEGFGYPLVEGMASGCPVISSAQSSMLELARDAARLVDPERPADVARAIVDLLQSSDERTLLRERGLLRARELSVGVMAAKTAEVYRQVAAAP